MSSTHDIPAQDGVNPHKNSFALDCGSPYSLQLTDTYQITVNFENIGSFPYMFELVKEP